MQETIGGTLIEASSEQANRLITAPLERDIALGVDAVLSMSFECRFDLRALLPLRRRAELERADVGILINRFHCVDQGIHIDAVLRGWGAVVVMLVVRCVEKWTFFEQKKERSNASSVDG